MNTIGKLACFIFVILLMVSCSNNKNLTTTFMKTHPDNEIIHIEKFGDEAVSMYIPSNKLGVGAAEYRKTNNEWNLWRSTTVSWEDKLIFSFARQGRKEEFLYGVINDPEIDKVMIKKENGNVINANIIEKNGISYWFIIGEYDEEELIGLSEDGKEVYSSYGIRY
jgi:hypothetical protein